MWFSPGQKNGQNVDVWTLGVKGWRRWRSLIMSDIQSKDLFSRNRFNIDLTLYIYIYICFFSQMFCLHYLFKIIVNPKSCDDVVRLTNALLRKISFKNRDTIFLVTSHTTCILHKLHGSQIKQNKDQNQKQT